MDSKERIRECVAQTVRILNRSNSEAYLVLKMMEILSRNDSSHLVLELLEMLPVQVFTDEESIEQLES